MRVTLDGQRYAGLLITTDAPDQLVASLSRLPADPPDRLQEVLYSDGLIEGTRGLDRGLADLRRTASASATDSPGRMVERLVREPASVAVDDDRVAVVLRRVTPKA